ncbi:MAG: type IX secretion system membrane protein PorP/SprF [Cytophagales bacterium]
MKKLLLSFIFYVGFMAQLLAQQDPQFTHYMFNTLYYNPGFAGVEGVTKFTALHRSQWLGYTPTNAGGGAPNTQIITMSTPIFKLNSGFGAQIVNDRLGVQNNLDAQVTYAYHLGIKNSKLSLGIRTGMYSQTFDYGQYRYVDPADPYFLTPDGSKKFGPESQIKPDLGIGVFWRKEKYYVGFSVNHLLKSSFDFGVKNFRGYLEPHYYLTGGYFYEVNFDLKFQFMGLLYSDLSKTSFNAGGIAYYKDTMWLGASFRTSESVNLMLGYSLLKDKSFKLGYALDYVLIEQAGKAATSHELMLSYELPVNPGSGKKVVRTPRYRH